MSTKCQLKSLIRCTKCQKSVRCCQQVLEGSWSKNPGRRILVEESMKELLFFDFECKQELSKGHFPHLFNRKENDNYVGPIPPLPYYNPNRMNPKDKAFLAWHASKKESNNVFNFQQEILAYCRSNVDILRRCCLEFCDLFYVTDINLFTSLTIASPCNLVYRTNYLPKDMICHHFTHGI